MKVDLKVDVSHLKRGNLDGLRWISLTYTFHIRCWMDHNHIYKSMFAIGCTGHSRCLVPVSQILPASLCFLLPFLGFRRILARYGRIILCSIITGWWFGTCFIFPYIGNNHPNWLIFFRVVETTNQIIMQLCHHQMQNSRVRSPRIATVSSWYMVLPQLMRLKEHPYFHI